MNTGGKVKLSNGLFALVDWASFTFKDEVNPKVIINLLGYSENDFLQLPKGRYGYASALKCFSCDLYILYSGKEDMGVHVDITGSAILEVLEHFYNKRIVKTPFGSDGYLTDSIEATVLSDLFRAIFDAGGSFSRIDLAVDDIGANYFTMDELQELLESNRCVSKFHGYRHDISRSFDGTVKGNTFYLGSRKSLCMLRIYDKQLEQNAKKKIDRISLSDTPWVRWELELKNEYATKAARYIIGDMLLGCVISGILGSYLRLIINDHSRKSNCTTLPKWTLFLGGVLKLSLYQYNEPKTIDDSINWLYKQVAPSLAMIITSFDGDMTIFMDMISNGRHRLSKRHIAMINAFRLRFSNSKEVFA